MNCFLWYMVDQPKAFSFMFSWDHCQRSSSSRISDTFSPLCLNFMVSEWGHNCPTFLSLFGSWQIYIIHKCNISALYNLIFKISLFAHPCKILSCFSNQLWYLDRFFWISYKISYTQGICICTFIFQHIKQIKYHIYFYSYVLQWQNFNKTEVIFNLVFKLKQENVTRISMIWFYIKLKWISDH